MNRREEIVAQVLARLIDWDAPVNEAVLHAAIESRIHPRPLKSELDEAVALAERSDWVSGIRSGSKGVRWYVTDAGRAEHGR